MNSQSPLEPVEIIDLSSEGHGVALVNGKTTFIQDALEGEQVTFEVKRKRARMNFASLKDVLRASELRVEPRCPHFGICGGCALQHLAENGQLEFKQKMLVKQLTHFGQVHPQTYLAPLQGPQYGYRRKARLGVKYVAKKEKVLIGFRERDGRKVADLNQCHTLHPRAACLIEPFAQLLTSLKCRSFVPQIEIAVGDEGQAWILRHLEDLGDEQERLVEFARSHHIDLYLQPNKLDSIHKVWPPDTPWRLRYSLEAFNLSYQFHPADFIQVNGLMNQRMVAMAVELLDLQSSDRVLDLFCGGGNFSLPLAQKAKEVIGVEGSAELVKRAIDNASDNAIENAHFFVGDLTQDVAGSPWLQSFDKIVIDPPRLGAQEILPLIAASQASHLLYVSCNPATLARDAGILVHQYGFKFKTCVLMDMFPQTHHAEVMALFIRSEHRNNIKKQ